MGGRTGKEDDGSRLLVVVIYFIEQGMTHKMAPQWRLWRLRRGRRRTTKKVGFISDYLAKIVKKYCHNFANSVQSHSECMPFGQNLGLSIQSTRSDR